MSRWLSIATPPEPFVPHVRIPKGCQSKRSAGLSFLYGAEGVHTTGALASLVGCGVFYLESGGVACAQPPANSLDASGI